MPSSVLPPLWTWSSFRACSDFALLGQSVHTCVVQEPVFPKPEDSDKEIAREEEKEETFLIFCTVQKVFINSVWWKVPLHDFRCQAVVSFAGFCLFFHTPKCYLQAMCVHVCLCAVEAESESYGCTREFVCFDSLMLSRVCGIIRSRRCRSLCLLSNLTGLWYKLFTSEN